MVAEPCSISFRAWWLPQDAFPQPVCFIRSSAAVNPANNRAEYPANYIAKVPMTEMSLRPNSTTGFPGRTYMWYNEEPVFEFGYGMHYTNFTANIQSNASSTYSISSLIDSCSETYKDRCSFNAFNVEVQNTGSVTSDYVALGFLAGNHGPAPYPQKRLAAYQRLHNITAGSSQTACLNMTLGNLARIDDMGNTVLYPGDYALLVDLQPLSMVNFTLTGDPVTLDLWPQPPAERFQTSDYYVGGYGSTYQTPVDGSV